LPQAPHATGLLVLRHRQCPNQRVRRLVDRVRVDDERGAQLTASAGELAQHENTAFIVARANKLFCHQIHTVVETANVTQIRRAIQPVDVSGFVVSFEQDDRTVTLRAVTTVDPSTCLDELGARRAVRRERTTTRFCDLHEHKLATQLWLGVK
jgi:hypothetical protein